MTKYKQQKTKNTKNTKFDAHNTHTSEFYTSNGRRLLSNAIFRLQLRKFTEKISQTGLLNYITIYTHSIHFIHTINITTISNRLWEMDRHLLKMILQFAKIIYTIQDIVNMARFTCGGNTLKRLKIICLILILSPSAFYKIYRQSNIVM